MGSKRSCFAQENLDITIRYGQNNTQSSPGSISSSDFVILTPDTRSEKSFDAGIGGDAVNDDHFASLASNYADQFDQPSTIKMDSMGLERSFPSTSEDWDRIRPIFIKLYSDENKTLNQVIEILEKDHSFRATRRMFNKRIKDWNLFKNLKGADKDEIIRRIEGQGDQPVDGVEGSGQSSRFESKHLHKIRRYQRTKDGRDSQKNRKSTLKKLELVQRQGRSGNNGDSVELAEPGRPLFTTGETSESEKLVWAIQNYFTSYLEARWNSPNFLKASRLISDDSFGPISFVHTGNSRSSAIKGPNPARLLDQYTASIKLMKRAQGQMGWKLMNELHEFAKDVFKAEHPRLIGVLIVMARTPLNEFPGLHTALWTYFANLAAIVYQNNRHPIVILCKYLGTTRTDHVSKELLFRQNYNIFRNSLGGHHDKTIRTKLNLCDFLLEGYHNKPEVRSMLNELVDESAVYDEKDIIVRTVLYRTAWIEEGQEHYDAAEAIYRDIMRRNEEAIGEYVPDRIVVRIPVRLAAMLAKQERLLESTRLLVQALRSSHKKFGINDYETLVVISALAEIYTKQGRLADVEVLKGKYPHAFNT